METCCPLPGRGRAWGGGALFPGLQGSKILKQLPEVMAGLLHSPPWDHTEEHLMLEGFIEAGSKAV